MEDTSTATRWFSEGTDRKIEVAVHSQGLATVNKALLLRGLSKYELWAMAYPCSIYELLNPLRYAKILVDKQPP